MLMLPMQRILGSSNQTHALANAGAREGTHRRLVPGHNDPGRLGAVHARQVVQQPAQLLRADGRPATRHRTQPQPRNAPALPGAPWRYLERRIRWLCLRCRCCVTAARRELPSSQALLHCQAVSSAALRRLWTFETRTMSCPEVYGSTQATHQSSHIRPSASGTLQRYQAECLKWMAALVNINAATLSNMSG